MVLRRSFTNSPDYIQSLDRGLQVLRAFNRERPRCTLSDIAAQIGLSRAVARAVYEAAALTVPDALPSWRDKFG